MTEKIFQIDAFADTVFTGNPASVIILQSWPVDKVLQAIAMENNQAETAFAIPKGNDFELRWFTPTIEVRLCGHATLATAHVIFTNYSYPNDSIRFHTLSGILTTTKISNDKYLLDFPSDFIIPYDKILLQDVLPINIKEAYIGKDDILAILHDEDEVKLFTPDFSKISMLPSRGLIISASSKEHDIVSRCFYPQSGVDEDAATGSAHTLLTPYWALKLRKNSIDAIQWSKRRGYLHCVFKGERTSLIGKAITYLVGEIYI